MESIILTFMLTVQVHLVGQQQGPVCRHCVAAAPPIFTVNFVFRSVCCFALMSKFASTKRVNNVSSLPKTLSTKLSSRHLFPFVWEALQMNVWSCERLQRRCPYSKVLEGLFPVNQAQPTCNCELELWFSQRRDGNCSDL